MIADVESLVVAVVAKAYTAQRMDDIGLAALSAQTWWLRRAT
jgi:hypothetical protein